MAIIIAYRKQRYMCKKIHYFSQKPGEKMEFKSKREPRPKVRFRGGETKNANSGTFTGKAQERIALRR